MAAPYPNGGAVEAPGLADGVARAIDDLAMVARGAPGLSRGVVADPDLKGGAVEAPGLADGTRATDDLLGGAEAAPNLTGGLATPPRRGRPPGSGGVASSSTS